MLRLSNLNLESSPNLIFSVANKIKESKPNFLTNNLASSIDSLEFIFILGITNCEKLFSILWTRNLP